MRVHLFGARELRSKDRFMGGLVEGKSDPYAVLRVGTQVANSRVVQNELSPTWDEVYEVGNPGTPPPLVPPCPGPPPPLLGAEHVGTTLTPPPTPAVHCA